MSSIEAPRYVFDEAREDPLNETKAKSESKGAAGVEIDLFADPLGQSEAQQLPEKDRAPLPNLSEAPPKSKASAVQGHANSEVFGAQQNDVKRSEDIFEEPPKDGTSKTAPKLLGGAAGGKKAPNTDLFGDDDGDDLFEEPLQAVAKKPQVKESSKVCTDQSKDATTDLFTEEVIRVPPAAAAAKPLKSSADTSSRTNGLHSDEDDLFTGASSLLCLYLIEFSGQP